MSSPLIKYNVENMRNFHVLAGISADPSGMKLFYEVLWVNNIGENRLYAVLSYQLIFFRFLLILTLFID